MGSDMSPRHGQGGLVLQSCCISQVICNLFVCFCAAVPQYLATRVITRGFLIEGERQEKWSEALRHHLVKPSPTPKVGTGFEPRVFAQSATARPQHLNMAQA